MDTDTRLLKDDPAKLLVRYQPVIRIIVKKLAYQGYLPKREINDLMQDVNRKLVERMGRISRQYNYKSKFKTYFSVVIRNICLEEFRKLRLVAEPQADIYEQTSTESATDQLTIKQEYERLQRAFKLFGSERSALWVTLRCYADLEVRGDDFIGFEIDPGEAKRAQIAGAVNAAILLQKREKMEVLSAAFRFLEHKPRSADALRKWASSRFEELLVLMNGKPPRSAYTVEILFILIEKSEYPENTE